MSVGGSASRSKDKSHGTSVSTTRLGKEGQRIQDINLDMAEQQLRILNEQEGFQRHLFEATNPVIDRLPGAFAEYDDFLKGDAGDLESLRRNGFSATPEQKRLIEEATAAALQRGQSDINAQLQEGLGLIRSELAPGLGLRPGDSPLIDRGGVLAREALRKSSDLSFGLRSQQAQAELEYPFKAAQQLTGIKEFQASLRDNAFRNRLALIGTTANAGLGLGQPSTLGAKFQPEVALGTRVNATRNQNINTTVGASGSYGTS